MVDFEKYRGEIMDCAKCGYPILVGGSPEVTCPFCGTRQTIQEVNMRGISENGIAQEGVVLPTWLVAGGIGLIIGVLFGPTLLASSREGALKLARIAEEKLKG